MKNTKELNKVLDKSLYPLTIKVKVPYLTALFKIFGQGA